jgi:transposase-like protein
LPDGLVGRGLKPPLLCIIDGHAGLRRAVGEVWARSPVQRCCVHYAEQRMMPSWRPHAVWDKGVVLRESA